MKNNLTKALIFIIGLLTGALVFAFFKLYEFQKDTQVIITEVVRSVSVSDTNSKSNPTDSYSFRHVANSVNPSVVYLEAVIKLNRSNFPNDSNHNFDEQFWDNFVPNRRAQTVGSGVIITQDGYIMTNNHVIEGAIDKKVVVVLNDNRTFNGTIVGRDRSTDLAVLKIDAKNLPAVPFGDSDELQVGDWVLAVGNPFRLRSTVTAGIVSALSRDVNIIDDRLRIENFIQTDAAINRGNSGGALVNVHGELIGINTAIATESGTYEGYGFAIPANMALKIGRDLIEFGEVKRAFLGVQIANVSNKRARELNLPSISGVEIVELVSNGAADLAGINSGDVVIAVNDNEVKTYNELQARIAEFRPGDRIKLSVWQNGVLNNLDLVLQGDYVNEELTINDTLENIEQELNQEPTDVVIEDLNSKIVKEGFHFGATLTAVPKPDNPFIFDLFFTTINSEGEAFKRGISTGDKLISVNNKRVETLKQFKEQLNKEASILLEVKKKNGTKAFYELKLN